MGARVGLSFPAMHGRASITASVEKRGARVDRVERWTNSTHRRRWMATTLLEIEPRLHYEERLPTPALLA